MKKAIANTLVAGLFSAGLILAQTAQPGEPEAPNGWHGRGRPVARMLRSLDLTADQKAQAKGIFQDAHAANQPLVAQMRDARKALADAAKAGATDDEINRLAANVGTATSQLAAARAKTFAKLYAILTPDQKTKLDNRMNRRFNRGNPAATTPAAPGL